MPVRALTLKGVDCEIPRRLERGMKRLKRTISEGVDCEIPPRLERGTKRPKKTIFEGGGL